MKVAHFGTFDIDNYGDLLFPHVLEWRMPDVEVEHISPTNSTTIFDDALDVAIAPRADVGAYILGGGNILNFRASRLLNYKNVKYLAYARLSIEPTLLASVRDKPFIINSPSISAKIHDDSERKILSVILNKASYIAFRDRHSVDLARKLSTGKVNLVPDTAFDISRMWPIENGAQRGGYVVAHVNKRYGGDVNDIARTLDGISRNMNVPIVLLPIGPCHGDIEYANKIAAQMETKSSVFSKFNLRDFALKIARADMYIGSSMHGFITAVSYSVPARLVLGPQVHDKFSGVLEATGLGRDAISETWQAVLSLQKPGSMVRDADLRDIFSRLDEHWRNVKVALSSPVQRERTPGRYVLYALVLLSQGIRGLAGIRKKVFR